MGLHVKCSTTGRGEKKKKKKGVVVAPDDSREGGDLKGGETILTLLRSANQVKEPVHVRHTQKKKRGKRKQLPVTAFFIQSREEKEGGDRSCFLPLSRKAGNTLGT